MVKLVLAILLLLLCGSLAYADLGRPGLGSPPLRIEEEDGFPAASPRTLKVPNSSLTNNSDGSVSLSYVTPSDLSAYLYYVSVPPSASAAGTVGQVANDSSYFYYAYGSNMWARIAKDPTWVPTNYYLLMEDGSFLLQENGDKIII